MNTKLLIFAASALSLVACQRKPSELECTAYAAKYASLSKTLNVAQPKLYEDAKTSCREGKVDSETRTCVAIAKTAPDVQSCVHPK